VFSDMSWQRLLNIRFINVAVNPFRSKADGKMSFASKLNIESKGMFATSIFYVIVGIVFLALLVMTGFPPHLGIIGVFSLVAAYGLFQKRSWSIWLIVILFFVATTFSVYMLNYYLSLGDYLMSLGVIAYLVLTWIFSVYAASKRSSLES